MKKVAWTMIVVSLGVLTAVFSCNNNTGTASAKATGISPDSLVKLGEYLVTAIGCDDCHTPKKMGPKGPELDMDRRFSGHPADEPLPPTDTTIVKKGWLLFNMGVTSYIGPWGQSYAANISSDETGIGNWTEQQFFTAIRKGKWKGLEESRPLMPPMPLMSFSQLKDQDLKAIFAYLKSTKPVKNVVPAWKPWNELAKK